MTAARRDLSGRTIVVTRPAEQAAGLKKLLERQGATVLAIPTIRIVGPTSYKALDKAIRELGSYDCVVFTSQNAVERFFARAHFLGFRPLKRPSWAIGPSTAAALKRRGWKALVPPHSRGESLARAIAGARGMRVLIPRAQKARAELPALLRRRGAVVDVVETYRTLPDLRGAARLKRLADAGRLNAVTFTSASTVDSFAAQVGAARWRKLCACVVLASIGPITSRALRERGARRIVQSSAADDAGLAAALARRLAASVRA